MLEFYSDKKDNAKVSQIVNEMELNFPIKLGKLEFGADNRKYTSDKENGIIYPSLLGVKFINTEVTNILYELGNTVDENITFQELYKILDETKGINKRHIETLIYIGYFHKYGNPRQLFRYVTAMRETFYRKQYPKYSEDPVKQQVSDIVKNFARHETAKLYKDIDYLALNTYIFNAIQNDKEDFAIADILSKEVELMGKTITEIPEGMTVGYIIARSWKKDVFLFKSWKNGAEQWVNSYDHDSMPGRDDIVLLYGFQSREKKTYGGKKRIDYWAEVEVLKKGKK